MLETTLIYNEQLIRHAVWLYWKRTVGRLYLWVLLAMTVGFFGLLFQGDRSWLIGLVGTILAISYLMLVSIYVAHFKNSMAKFRDVGSPSAIFRAEALTFTIESGIGTSKLQWSAVKEIWQFEDVWLLLFSKAQFSTLPVANLPIDLQAFILEKVRLEGGKIL